MTEAQLIRIAIETDGEVETIWAEKVGRDRYRIRNQPAFAWGMSFDDVVSAKGRDGRLFLDRVITRGGHSTYRLMLSEGISWEAFERAWPPLQAIGCRFEAFTQRFIGVDVPPSTDIYEAHRLLEAGMSSGVWRFDEVHVGHPLTTGTQSGGWRAFFSRVTHRGT